MTATPGTPVVFGRLKRVHRPPRMAPPKPEHPNSRFFFDMLMSLDTNVVGEYIMPHLPPITTNAGQSLLASIVRISEDEGRSAGFMNRDILWDFWVPSCKMAPSSWLEGGNITFKDIVAMTAFHRRVFLS